MMEEGIIREFKIQKASLDVAYHKVIYQVDPYSV
jgi:hypothetical protein